MNLSAMKIDGQAVQNGGWVDDIPGLPGVRFKVRGFASQAFRALPKDALAAIPAADRKAGLSESQLAEMDGKLLAGAILLDWQGLEDDGQPFDYSAERAAAFLQDPDYEPFRNAVTWAAGEIARPGRKAA